MLAATTGQQQISTTQSDRTACAGRAKELKCAIGEMRASELEEREKNLLMEALLGRGWRRCEMH